MANRMPGMYQAEVLDTADFKETGRIKVHLMGTANPDVYEMVGVMTPFGGLPNMGMQALPPIGAVGLVMYIRERERHPVWIGSLLRYWQDEEEKELDEGIANPVEVEDPSDFVVKTQYTKTDDQELDGDNRVENVIKLNEEGILLSKIQNNDNYNYETEAKDYTDEYPANTISIRDNEIRLKVRTDDNGADREFIVNGDELRLEWGEDQTITVKEDKTIIKNGEADIVIDNSGKVLVNAEKIELNGTDGTGMFYEGFRDFVNNAFNNHTHGTPSGPSSPPVAPYTSSSTAKSQNVKLS
jgi:hypothetical protein